MLYIALWWLFQTCTIVTSCHKHNFKIKQPYVCLDWYVRRPCHRSESNWLEVLLVSTENWALYSETQRGIRLWNISTSQPCLPATRHNTPDLVKTVILLSSSLLWQPLTTHQTKHFQLNSFTDLVDKTTIIYNLVWVLFSLDDFHPTINKLNCKTEMKARETFYVRIYGSYKL